MEHVLEQWAAGAPWALLLGTIALSFFLLAKGADWMVEEAVRLALRWRVPKLIVGATIVSLGTTLPEAAVSVLAALRGRPGLALGNAVGSIVCDTGLILGLAALLGPIPLPRKMVLRQGWMQFGAGLLLAAAGLFGGSVGAVFQHGGRIPRPMGFVFLALLAGYLWLSVRWSAERTTVPPEDLKKLEEEGWLGGLWKLVAGAVLIVFSSRILILSAVETAARLRVPEGVIAVTLVAFGTSLPELVTAVTAVRRGHGDMALGNIIGADILNVLFVAGAAAAVTPGGLPVPPAFFRLFFPGMLLILGVFRFATLASGSVLKKRYAALLVLLYAVFTLASYTHAGSP